MGGEWRECELKVASKTVRNRVKENNLNSTEAGLKLVTVNVKTGKSEE